MPTLETSNSWVIAAICCFINFLHLGIARQSGLLYLAAISRYNADRSQASLPFVLCYTVRNISGPFIGFLGRRIGSERVITLGCILAAIAMGTCFLADDILTVTILWGGVFGLGFGMGSVLIPVVLNQHFDKHLSNANGIAFGGECVAGFILPVLVKIFLDSFGTSGLFLILSGLMLHSIPAAMMLKIFATRHSKSSVPKPVSVYNDDSTQFSTPNGVCKKPCFLDDNDKSSRIESINIGLLSNSNISSVTVFKTLNEDKFIYDNLPSEPEVEDSNHVHNKTGVVGFEFPEGNVTSPKTVLKDKIKIHDGIAYQKCESLSSNFQQGEIAGISPQKSTETSALSLFRVFYDPAFILMLLTQSCFIFIATMIMTIIVDLSRDAGASSEEEIYILMCLSISDMIGRFGLGWVTDMGYMSTVTFSALCFFSLGSILTSLTILKGFVLIMCAAFFIGLFLGGLLVVCPCVVSDYIEKEYITMALASRYVLYAPMSLTQSSLIGFFRGTKGSYNGILYMLTGVCLICCAMSLSIPFATRIREKRKLARRK